MTILEVLAQARDRLKGAGIDTAALDARVLMCHALGISREALLTREMGEITDGELQQFEGYLRRRINREPVSRILNQREFWSLNFELSPHTLDPRPDSETLIEAVLDMFPDRAKPLRILDLGTGTGCLIITLLREFPNAQGIGVDVSPEALRVASRNGHNLGVEDRVTFQESNWFDRVEGKFDVIISNPPYVPTGDLQGLEPEVREFDPHGALFAGREGLDDYRRLIPEFHKYLSPEGSIFLEIGEGQEESVKYLLEENGLQFYASRADIQGIPRCVMGCVVGKVC